MVHICLNTGHKTNKLKRNLTLEALLSHIFVELFFRSDRFAPLKLEHETKFGYKISNLTRFIIRILR